MLDPGSNPQPVFADDDSPTVAFFRDQATRPGALRFPARNFLLDEGVVEDRSSSYHRLAGVDFADGGAWTAKHCDYLDEAVFLQQRRGIPKSLDPARPDQCPETFRYDAAFRGTGSAYRKLRLIRVVEADFVAQMAGLVTTAELVESCDEVLAARFDGRDPLEDALDIVESVFLRWPKACQLRPVWGSFLKSHEDLFGIRPADDAEHWPDTLRDRLGLSHVDPVVSPRSVLVFVYPASAVPRRRGFTGVALATPTVLDSTLSPAFCPAPRESQEGRVVHLGAPAHPPSPEIVHPFFAPTIDHLFRVGEVRRRIPADLEAARRAHLQHLRQERIDYADATDTDLLGATP